MVHFTGETILHLTLLFPAGSLPLLLRKVDIGDDDNDDDDKDDDEGDSTQGGNNDVDDWRIE